MTSQIKRLFIADGVSKNVYFWTVLSGVLYAGSSFAAFLTVTHALGEYSGGIFSIGLAISQQMITVGYFAMRRYQASDSGELYSFAEYTGSRIVTTALMLTGGCAWMIFGNFSYEKKTAIFWLLILKASEAFSDILGGRYQQQNRFDIACKAVFIKTAVSLMLFIAIVIFYKNMTTAMIAMAVSHIALTLIIDGPLLHDFGGFRPTLTPSKILPLLSACFPLFVNSFLMMYVNNAPKYAIDKQLGESELAQFSALFMVSFVISIFAEFIINPQITKAAEAYNSGRTQIFHSLLVRQTISIFSLGLIGIVATWFAGTDLLTFCFGIELHQHRIALCVLLIGGMLLALYQLAQLVLIVLRRQIWCMPGILLTSTFIFFASPRLIASHGLLGGAIGYSLAMALMMTVFATLAFIFMAHDTRNRHGLPQT